jgi:propionate CoA-transferase
MSTVTTTLSANPAEGISRPDLLIDARQAAELIPVGAVIAVGGSGSLLQVAETILDAVGVSFRETGVPSALTVVHTMGLGDHTGRGVDHIAQQGLVNRFIGSHFVLSPAEQTLIATNEVEAIGLPAGTISLLYREIAAQRPGLFTDIGIGTFVDPRQQWGRMNEATRRGLSELVTIGGREWLFYPRFPIDVAIIRATAADVDGNLSMDDEAAWSDNLAIAQAVHNCGGVVVAEVKEVLGRGAIPASRVRVPGIIVDHVVLTHFPHQTPITSKDPTRTGLAVNAPIEIDILPLDHRKVIARRAAMELREGELVNLGVGMANGISYVALEEGFLDEITLTVEQGIYGGLPGLGLDSGTAINPSAIIDMSSQFDFYDGGALDFAGLAFAQVDRWGNVNVGRVGQVPIGPGGFIDISQKASSVAFCGTFRGGDLDIGVSPTGIQIRTDGRYDKFVERIDYVSFNAELALAEGRKAFYITERAVFVLGQDGLELIEVAPGVDLEKDVLALLPFTPVIRRDPILMDARLFRVVRMGIRPGPRRPTADSRRERRARA